MNLPSVATLFERLPRTLRRHWLMRWWKTKVIRAVYFEYFEKLLSRVQPPRDIVDF